MHTVLKAKERENAESAWQDSGLVFTIPTGGTREPANFTRRFRGFLDGLDSAASASTISATRPPPCFWSRGVDLVVIKELLGHAHIGVTTTVHAHVRLRLQRDAIDTLSTALGSP